MGGGGAASRSHVVIGSGPWHNQLQGKKDLFRAKANRHNPKPSQQKHQCKKEEDGKTIKPKIAEELCYATVDNNLTRSSMPVNSVAASVLKVRLAALSTSKRTPLNTTT